jgi:mono/diheme cytochrome c family protein
MKISANKILCLVLLSSAISVSSVSFAGEKTSDLKDTLAHGEQAHKKHCYKCHSDDVYTRDNRFVKSIDALSKQVVRCKEGSDIPWFDEDADAVVQFLNNKYYRF